MPEPTNQMIVTLIENMVTRLTEALDSQKTEILAKIEQMKQEQEETNAKLIAKIDQVRQDMDHEIGMVKERIILCEIKDLKYTEELQKLTKRVEIIDQATNEENVIYVKHVEQKLNETQEDVKEKVCAIFREIEFDPPSNTVAKRIEYKNNAFPNRNSKAPIKVTLPRKDDVDTVMKNKAKLAKGAM